MYQKKLLFHEYALRFTVFKVQNYQFQLTDAYSWVQVVTFSNILFLALLSVCECVTAPPPLFVKCNAHTPVIKSEFQDNYGQYLSYIYI